MASCVLSNVLQVVPHGAAARSHWSRHVAFPEARATSCTRSASPRPHWSTASSTALSSWYRGSWHERHRRDLALLSGDLHLQDFYHVCLINTSMATMEIFTTNAVGSSSWACADLRPPSSASGDHSTQQRSAGIQMPPADAMQVRVQVDIARRWDLQLCPAAGTCQAYRLLE
jgi:hypothetical protein